MGTLVSDHDYYAAYAEEDDGPQWDEDRIMAQAEALERARLLTEELEREQAAYEAANERFEEFMRDQHKQYPRPLWR